MSGRDPAGDHELAAEIARLAGDLLREVDRETEGWEARARGDEGDRRSGELIASLLAEARPDDGLLMEDNADGASRLSNPRVWIVDPLDGTREFGEGGRVDWAVHVALWVGDRLEAGAVALPAAGIVHTTSAPPAPHPAAQDRPVLIAVSRSRPPEVAQRLVERTGSRLVPLGSAGYKVMAVVTGEVDAYVHAGGQYEWDSAAPVAVALAAGLHASRLDGSALVYNQPDPWLPDLVVCRPDLAEALLAVAAGG